MNIFVGNLSTDTTEEQLNQLFSPFGQVMSVKIISDNYTKRSRGFGFVEMPDKASADQAIEKLNNSSLESQTITVNEARPKTNNNMSDNFNRRRY